jgi:protocatechuate 3,4-dioxygenase beta subunit
MLSYAIAFATIALLLVHAQTSPHVAPTDAPSSGRLAPATEPGARLVVSGVVVSDHGTPVGGASLYAYQTDAEGYYGVKPASDNQHPRLSVFLRTDVLGEWSFDTIRPGSYPNSRIPAHIHLEVVAPGFAPRRFEIIFDGDPFITEEMRHNPAFSVKSVAAGVASGPGRVLERIVLEGREP